MTGVVALTVKSAIFLFLIRPGLMQMYGELQILTPVIPTREFYFVRYCQQIEQHLWAVVDVSVDMSRENLFAPASRSRRLPSGCLIHDMSNGYSKVRSFLPPRRRFSAALPKRILIRRRSHGSSTWRSRRRAQFIIFTEV